MYDALLDFTKIEKMKIRAHTEWNYSYYPILFSTEEVLLKVLKLLNDNGVFPRRYFYPSLNTIPYANGIEMLVSEALSSRVLCLPLYVGLEKKEIEQICNLINS